MRSLAADDGRSSTAGVLGAAALLGLWAAWLTLARVPVYEQSASARVEVGRAVYPVETSEAGRVAVNRMRLGLVVQPDDALLELDVRAEELQRSETQTRLDAIEPQLVALRAQLAAGDRALAEAAREHQASLRVARARLQESRALAANARAEAVRAERLQGLGHGAAADAERARAQAESQSSAAEALASELTRLEYDGQSRESARRGDLARLRGDVARLEGDRATLQAGLATLTNSTARRVIRAPVAGRLGSLVELRPGSVVTVGQRLATVVPDGELRVVGEFAPTAALGRIRAGQTARLRLDGFPWAQWGMVSARVRTVGAEAREGAVRVELALVRRGETRIPLEHGLPGSVEVEVERVSPAVLLLRAAGQLVRRDEAP
jgi:multidrug resistance efflux pump